MNKTLRIFIAILGGINTIYGMFIPIAVALIVVKFYPQLETFPRLVVIIGGSLSSLFKAIDVAFLREN